MSVIALLHPGAMGAAIGAELVGVGHEVRWLSAGRSAASAERAQQAGLIACSDTDTLLEGAEVVISICPPAAAGEVAAAVAGFGGLYLDANAIAPASARAILALQPGLVDGGIVGPPPEGPHSTRLFLSGPRAGQIATLFTGTQLGMQVLSERVGDASALKLAYAAWTKGGAALLLAIRAFAAAEGVEAALLAEWATSQPGLEARSERALTGAADKGWRWAGEMEEIAAAFTANGLPSGFGEAAAAIYAEPPR